MQIRKWYLDCVGDDGTTWIGYWGDVRLGSRHVSFVSSLLYDGALSSTESTLRAEGEPSHDNGRMAWSAASLGVEAEWIASASAFGSDLYDGVSWRCVMPRGDAVVRVRDRTIRGRGYAELLEMSIAPWRLPIRELRWGRAIGESTSLVWIQWNGRHPLQLAARDGALEAATHIGDDEVRLASGMRVAMSNRVVVREESLATLLRPLAWLVPRSFNAPLKTMEQKWRSRGTIFDGDGRPIDEGWVIHELLRFAAD